MSTLQTNNIYPYSGDTIALSGSFVDVPGVLTVDTSITSSGDLRFPDLGNGVVNPIIPNVSASGTSSLNFNGISTTNSTTNLNYGINIIEYSTSEDYCVKLPSTPTKGKELTVVNLSGLPIYLFPGTEGGSINGIVGNDVLIPSDGVAYKFTCWENPLPGGWSLVSNGTSNIVQSDVIGGLEISQSLYSPYYNHHAVVNNNVYAINGGGFGLSTGFAYDPLNNPLHDAGLNYYNVYLGTTYSFLTPDPVWKNINSVTLYTNLDFNSGVGLDTSYSSNFSHTYYQAGTNIESYPLFGGPFANTSAIQQFDNDYEIPFFNNLNIPYYYSGGDYITPQYYGETTNQVPGTFTPVDPSYTPISAQDFTGYLSANPGDPGTKYYTLDFTSINNDTTHKIGKGCGTSFIGTLNNVQDIGNPFNISHDVYFRNTFNFHFQTSAPVYINGLKLKIVVDYTPL
jgi:hypothetical protein